MSDESLITARIDGSLAAIRALRDQVDRICDIANVVVERLQGGGTLYTAGNGGSAAQAMHLAEELHLALARAHEPQAPVGDGVAQRIVDVQRVHRDDAEHGVYALCYERFDDRFSCCHLGHRIR